MTPNEIAVAEALLKIGRASVAALDHQLPGARNRRTARKLKAARTAIQIEVDTLEAALSGRASTGNTK